MKTKNIRSDESRRVLTSSLGTNANFLLARANSRGIATANDHLRALGLKVRSFSVLSLARTEPGPTQRELAKLLMLDPSQIVPLVDDLEIRGLVRREQDPADRRSKIITATPAGEALHAVAYEAARAAEKHSTRSLSDSERNTLIDLLVKLAVD